MKASKSIKYFVDYDTVQSELRTSSHEEQLVENIDMYTIIQKLNKKLKTVIILRFFENLKIEEIAYITKTNSNTVKSRLYKGIEEIKKSIGGRSI